MNEVESSPSPNRSIDADLSAIPRPLPIPAIERPVPHLPRSASLVTLVLALLATGAALATLAAYLWLLSRAPLPEPVSSQALLLFSAPFLASAALLLIFATAMILLWFRVSLREAALQVYLQTGDRPDVAMFTLGQLAGSGGRFSAPAPVETLAAGDWVLARFSEGSAILAIPEAQARPETLAEMFHDDAGKLRLLRRSEVGSGREDTPR